MEALATFYVVKLLSVKQEFWINVRRLLSMNVKKKRSAMDNGEVIGLTVGGQLFSKMKVIDDEYMEFRDDDCCTIGEK